jgi:3-methylfumaryl-CoA hydratase
VRKQGRSGPLHFVTVRTEVSQGGQVVIAEEQDLVYREPGANGPARSGQGVAPAGRDWPVTVDPVLLYAADRVTASGVIS